MSTVEVIEGIFVAHASAIDGIAHVYANEPTTIDRKLCPMLTMFFLLPQGVETETGPTEEVDYRWDIYLYLSLADFESAQTQMKQLACEIVSNFRQHRSDYDQHPGDLDLFARALRRKEPPIPADDESWLRAAWELQVTVNEA